MRPHSSLHCATWETTKTKGATYIDLLPRFMYLFPMQRPPPGQDYSESVTAIAKAIEVMKKQARASCCSNLETTASRQ